jgi:hypothetical protein
MNGDFNKEKIIKHWIEGSNRDFKTMMIINKASIIYVHIVLLQSGLKKLKKPGYG